ncbi:MAG: asparagine synthase, partial [Anaerolineae bacterium]|nr:asparagine synthase [Anaerolineae bacterium]
PQDGERYLPDEQVLETFEPLLRQAVARCFAVGVDGILLSGGLDSSAIAGIAHQITQEQGSAPLAAFASTRTPDEPISYEQLNQRAIVDRLGMPYQTRSYLDFLDERDLVTISIDATAHSSEPNTYWWAGLYPHFLRSIVDAGCSSALSGVGADEWLDVDSSYFPDTLRSLSLPRLKLFLGSMRQEGKWRQRSLTQRLSVFTRQMIGAYWAHWLPNLRKAYRIRRIGGQLPGWLCTDTALRQTLQQTLNEEIYRPELDAHSRVPASYYEEGKRYLWKFLAESSVCETDFLYAHTVGLRILMPFFDRDLVTMLAKASPWVLLREGRSKSLSRMVVRRILPELGVEAQVKDYVAEELRPYFQEIQKNVVSAVEKVGTSRLAGYGIINSDKLKVAEKAGQNITYNDTISLYAIVSAETWLKHKLVGDLRNDDVE